MKKLITLILVLTGMVCTAGATDYTVYFKPNSQWESASAKFALYMYDKSSGTVDAWADFSETTLSGVFKATYSTDYYANSSNTEVCGIIIVRLNPSATKTDGKYSFDGSVAWNQSGDLSSPTSDIYYDISENTGTWSSWIPSWEKITTKVPSDYDFCIAANPDIVNTDSEGQDISWNGNSSYNMMSNNSDKSFDYTLTVSNKVLVAKSYEFKPVENADNWWSGGTGDGGNYVIDIAENGVYNITYNLNKITGVCTATPSLVERLNVDYYIERAADIEGSSYEELGKMAIHNGEASLGVNLTLEGNTNEILYKIKRVAKTTDGITTKQEKWLSASESSTGYHFTFTPSSAGNFAVSFVYDIAGASTNVIAVELADGYYYVGGGSGSWTLGEAFTETGSGTGVYTITLTSDQLNHGFCIAPVYALSGSAGNYGVPADAAHWAMCIRPETNTTISSFAIYEGVGQQASAEKYWSLTFNGTLTLKYDSNTNDWSATPYRTASIGPAGYITYSNGEKCKVSGAEAIYVITQDNGNGTVHGKEMDANTVWPANEGMILKGNNKDVITISAVASDETPSTIGNNYLVGSGNSTADITAGTGIYIFAMKSNGLGFYKAEDGTLAAHKAYLDLSRTSFNAREFLGFDFDEGEATGISAAKTEIGQDDQVVYDLQGRKINGQCSKGLYIVNGKKVIIK